MYVDGSHAAAALLELFPGQTSGDPPRIAGYVILGLFVDEPAPFERGEDSTWTGG